jgi:hypothetical protein
MPADANTVTVSCWEGAPARVQGEGGKADLRRQWRCVQVGRHSCCPSGGKRLSTQIDLAEEVRKQEPMEHSAG